MTTGLNFWKKNYSGLELAKKLIMGGSELIAYRMTAGLNSWKKNHSGLELTKNELWRV
jgi:hypothetical protein